MQLPTQLLRRKADTHKGDYGHVLIIAGSARYSGAAVLAASAAMRSGAGLVTIALPKSINNAVIKIKPLEVMTLPLSETSRGALSFKARKDLYAFIDTVDVVLIGPGLGREKSTQRLIRSIVSLVTKPLVIDADGLNALEDDVLILKKGSRKRTVTVITPHAGEMSRLTGASSETIKHARKEVAKSFASDYNCITVLKGNRSIVTSPEGNLFINDTGNPGMATAGTGDVLSGMIAAFIGQGIEGFRAVRAAVYLHGLAADSAARQKTEISLIASDIIDSIPQAFKQSQAKRLCRLSSVGRAAVL